MRMHSPKFKKNNNERKAYPTGGLPFALRARQPATPKSFPALAAVSLLEEWHPRPNSPQKPQPHPPPAETRSIPATGTPVACSASRKSRTMQPFIREQLASPGNTSPSHSKQQVKKCAVIPGKEETALNFRRYQPKKPGTLPGGNRGLKENPKTNTAPPKSKTRRQPAPSRMVGRLGTLNMRGYG
ncbi:Uncharacterised protein [Mobiluncus mulieris]|nr:Uncharacterised protein [Mobiluncus mulieris]